MKQKTIIILCGIEKLLRQSKRPLSCKEITQELRPNINIAYRDMYRYLEMIKNQLIVIKIKGNGNYYKMDKRKSLVLEKENKI